MICRVWRAIASQVIKYRKARSTKPLSSEIPINIPFIALSANGDRFPCKSGYLYIEDYSEFLNEKLMYEGSIWQMSEKNEYRRKKKWRTGSNLWWDKSRRVHSSPWQHVEGYCSRLQSGWYLAPLPKPSIDWQLDESKDKKTDVSVVLVCGFPSGRKGWEKKVKRDLKAHIDHEVQQLSCRWLSAFVHPVWSSSPNPNQKSA